MKIACSTVVFRQQPLDTALRAIRKLGYEYMETQAMSPWCPHADVDQDDPVAYGRHVGEFGFKGITGLWMSHGRLIADEKSLEYGIRTVEWAAAAGIPVVITGDGMKPNGMDDETAFRIIEERLSLILDSARRHGIKIAIEPHGTFSLTATGLKRLMSISDDPCLGINYDAANIHRAGYVENREQSYGWSGNEQSESEWHVLRQVAGRVIYFHAKDLRRGACTALGEGDVKVAACMKILMDHGYDGTFSLETEGDGTYEESVEIARKSFGFLNKETKIGP